jgi:hypothetical protein
MSYVEQRIAEIKQQGDLRERSVRKQRFIRQETTRHGKKVFYFRRDPHGPRVRLPDPGIVGRQAFNQAYEAAMRGKPIPFVAHSTVKNLPSYSLTIGRPGFVYFIRMGDAVKIGFSADVGKRLNGIQTACPGPAEVIKIIPGSDQTERYFHVHFANYRQQGEWFRLEGALAAFLAVSA